MTADVARAHVKDLLARYMGPGKTQEWAMRRVEELFGIPYWTQHGLLYKARKDVKPGVLSRILSARAMAAEQALRREIAEIKVELAKDRGTDLESALADAERTLEALRKAREAA